MKCDKCDKVITDEHGNLVAGLTLVVYTADSPNEETMAFLQKQMGKYLLDKKYNFCFECLLDTLFTKSLTK